MDDLKQQVLDKVWADLVKNSLTKPFTGDVLINTPIHFVEWALKKTVLYKACWVDPNGGGKYLYGLSEEFYHEYAFKVERFKHLSEKEFQMHHLETLILISGLISLQMSWIISLSHDEIIQMITKILGDIAQGQKLELNF